MAMLPSRIYRSLGILLHCQMTYTMPLSITSEVSPQTTINDSMQTHWAALAGRQLVAQGEAHRSRRARAPIQIHTAADSGIMGKARRSERLTRRVASPRSMETRTRTRT